MTAYFMGLMSGTSLDGVDAVLIDCQSSQADLIATHYVSYPQAFREALDRACSEDNIKLETLGTLDIRLGQFLAKCTRQLLQKADIKASEVIAIGSHGHTLHHNPSATPPYTIQIGDPNSIVAQTGITTIADFRRMDMALGGQGAPLVPAFHQAVFQHKQQQRVIVNIGGIANITVLPAGEAINVSGFDTGPGNTLLDLWVQKYQQKQWDEHGQWAASGSLNQGLLQCMLNDAYFSEPPPKSTGTDYFSAQWLEALLNQYDGEAIAPADVQHTLCHLTAISIANAIQKQAGDLTEAVYVCGGGAHNRFLLQLLQARLNCPLSSTEALGINPDWVEAMAFAWLAKKAFEHQTGNLPAVTGASKPAILGGIYHV